jgi:hypothetical protein
MSVRNENEADFLGIRWRKTSRFPAPYPKEELAQKWIHEHPSARGRQHRRCVANKSHGKVAGRWMGYVARKGPVGPREQPAKRHPK